MSKTKQSIKKEVAGVPQSGEENNPPAGGKKKKFFLKKREKKAVPAGRQEETQQVAVTKEDKIIGLLEENLDVSRQILWFNKRIIHWIFWQKMKSLFYLILIVVPLILAIFYLPPILEGLFEQYQDLWTTFNTLRQGGPTLEISPEYLEQLKALEQSGVLNIPR